MSAPSQEDFKHHISGSFNSDIETLRTDFLRMGAMVTEQIHNGIYSLLEADHDMAQQVEASDKAVNALENEIDAEVIKILALRQPTASDLRMVMAISKSTADIERIGDEATKIARIAVQITEKSESNKGYMEARHIANLVIDMTNDALTAFANLDGDLAFAVMRADADVDREYQMAARSLMTYMMEDHRSIARVINVLWVLRALERIGDHARNVAEQVIYVIKGTPVRHTDYETIEQHMKG